MHIFLLLCTALMQYWACGSPAVVDRSLWPRLQAPGYAAQQQPKATDSRSGYSSSTLPWPSPVCTVHNSST